MDEDGACSPLLSRRSSSEHQDYTSHHIITANRSGSGAEAHKHWHMTQSVH